MGLDLQMLSGCLDDFGDAGCCILVDMVEKFGRSGAADEQVSLNRAQSTSSCSFWAAVISLRVFLERDLPLCSASASVANFCAVFFSR